MADEPFDKLVGDNLVVNKRLGIGISEPATQLHIATAATEGISSQVFVESLNGSLLKVTAESNSASIGTENAFPLSIQTDGVPRIVISGTGNITITESLSVQNSLTVTGNTSIGTDTTPANLQVKGNVTANAFSGNGTSLSGLVKQAGDTMTGPLTIQSNLSVSGNVGVGTSSATDAKLTVNGTVKATAFQGDGSRLTGKVNTAGDIMTGPLTIQSNFSVNGNVGIGTDKPTAKLEVNGNIKADSINISRQSGGQFSGMATFESRNPEPPYINWFHNRLGDNPIRYGYIQAGDFGNSKELRFVTENGANFSFTNGNVGIGTANPQEKLHIASGGIKVSATTIAAPGSEVIREVLPLALASNNNYVDINGGWTAITRTIYSVLESTVSLPGSQRKYKLVIRNGNNGRYPDGHISRYRLFYSWANQADNKEYNGYLYWGNLDEGAWDTVILDHLVNPYNPSGAYNYWRLEGYTSGCVNRVFNVSIQIVDVIQ